jgi:hypothetical protein
MSAIRKTIPIVAVIALLAGAAVVLANRGEGEAPTTSMHAAAFAWLRPQAVPSTWDSLRLPGSPASLPVPAGWQAAHGDPGTRTAELRSGDEIDGYLNATPRQGKEGLAGWSEFRIEHNRDEGDRDVKLLAAATGFRFHRATGSCVLDSYRTSTGNAYREIACIVAGRSATTVIVGAAPPQRWAAEAPAIKKAIAGFTT